MRCWHPRAVDVIKKVKEFNPEEIILLPLYPQFSAATSGSSINEWNHLCKKENYNVKTKTICCYPTESNFVKSHANLIRNTIQDTESNPHPRKEIKSKFKVWPLLDFQSAIEDHEQGVTHIIRGKDLMASTRNQTLLYEKLGWDYPETLYWGRVKIHEFGGFSTSSMREEIERGEFEGWDDPRLPTIMSFRRRGFDSKAISDFWIDYSKSRCVWHSKDDNTQRNTNLRRRQANALCLVH